MSLDPVTMMGAGMALNAGGSILGGQNSQARVGAVQRARDDAMQREQVRQGQYMAEATPIVVDHLATRSAGNEASQRDTAFKARDAAITANQGQPQVAIASQSQPGQGEYARIAANLGRIVSDNARRQAVLSSYGDAAAENSRSFKKASDKVGTISNFAAGSASVLPAEFASADANAYADNPPSPFADLLKAAGTGLSMYGAFQPAGGTTKFSSIDELIRQQRLA